MVTNRSTVRQLPTHQQSANGHQTVANTPMVANLTIVVMTPTVTNSYQQSLNGHKHTNSRQTVTNTTMVVTTLMIANTPTVAK